jgi:hypothetical protein
MQEPTLGSLEEASQSNSDLRIVLRELIRAHGTDAMKRELRSIEGKPVENPRSRGRPVGPAIDDWPSLREAAAIWRERGGGPVWPALIAVAKSLPGESESHTRRLHGRLLSKGRGSLAEVARAGIVDFWMAAWDRKIRRMIARGARYIPDYPWPPGMGLGRITFSDVLSNGKSRPRASGRSNQPVGGAKALKRVYFLELRHKSGIVVYRL